MKSYTIGITGGSGSGKSYFIQKLSSYFSADELCIISQDNYYKPKQAQLPDERGVTNFDLPDGIDLEQLYTDLLKLKNGESVSLKEYTYNNAAAKPAMITLHPAPILVVEGLFVQYHPAIRKELDLKIFIEAKDYIKLARRIKRDNDERGYDLQDVLYRYENHVMPIYERLISPFKDEADIVIPNNSRFDNALQLIANALRTKLK